MGRPGASGDSVPVLELLEKAVRLDGPVARYPALGPARRAGVREVQPHSAQGYPEVGAALRALQLPRESIHVAASLLRASHARSFRTTSGGREPARTVQARSTAPPFRLPPRRFGFPFVKQCFTAIEDACQGLFSPSGDVETVPSGRQPGLPALSTLSQNRFPIGSSGGAFPDALHCGSHPGASPGRKERLPSTHGKPEGLAGKALTARGEEDRVTCGLSPGSASVSGRSPEGG